MGIYFSVHCCWVQFILQIFFENLKVSWQDLFLAGYMCPCTYVQIISTKTRTIRKENKCFRIE